MRKVLLAAAMLCGASLAHAADLTTPVPGKAAFTLPTVTCTTATCSGFYVGGSLVGQGNNANILGNGINGSVFSAGGGIGLDLGYQLWNGSWFAALEVDGLYQSTNPSSATVVANGFAAMELVKLGGNLGSLFASNNSVAGASPSQGPISIPTQLQASLISPYVSFGYMESKGGSQWVTGAGAQFTMGAGWTADLSYEYGAPTPGLNAANIIKLSINRMF